MNTPLDLVFMGTPEFSVPALSALLSNPQLRVVAVYTQPPRPKGRGQIVTFSPVHTLALSHGIPVYTPKSFRKDPDAVQGFIALHADVAVVAAYGLILPKAVLEAPRFGCLNIHASLLPRWRGASPIQRAIEAGDTETGVTIMRMDEGLDTGPMILRRAVPIGPETVAASLHDSLSFLGATLIQDVLERLSRGEMPSPEAQDDSQSTYAPLLQKSDGLVNWGRSAGEIDRQVRAFTPWPGSFTHLPGGKSLRVLEGRLSDISLPGEDGLPESGTLLSKSGDVLCGERSVYRLVRVQPDSGRPMSFSAFLSGNLLRAGDRFL